MTNELIEKLIDATFEIMHHDIDRKEKEAIWESDVLRTKFKKILAGKLKANPDQKQIDLLRTLAVYRKLYVIDSEINSLQWDDAFTDEPQCLTNSRHDKIKEKEALQEELGKLENVTGHSNRRG